MCLLFLSEKRKTTTREENWVEICWLRKRQPDTRHVFWPLVHCHYSCHHHHRRKRKESMAHRRVGNNVVQTCRNDIMWRYHIDTCDIWWLWLWLLPVVDEKWAQNENGCEKIRTPDNSCHLWKNTNNWLKNELEKAFHFFHNIHISPILRRRKLCIICGVRTYTLFFWWLLSPPTSLAEFTNCFFSCVNF